MSSQGGKSPVTPDLITKRPAITPSQPTLSSSSGGGSSSCRWRSPAARPWVRNVRRRFSGRGGGRLQTNQPFSGMDALIHRPCTPHTTQTRCSLPRPAPRRGHGPLRAPALAGGRLELPEPARRDHGGQGPFRACVDSRDRFVGGHWVADRRVARRSYTNRHQDVETRQGLYKEYTVDSAGQKYENAEGTFKTKGACVRVGGFHNVYRGMFQAPID